MAVGVVNVDRLTAAAALIAAVRRSFGPVPVVAGGAAIPDEETARSLAADGWATATCKVGPLISEIAAAGRNSGPKAGATPRRALQRRDSQERRG